MTLLRAFIAVEIPLSIRQAIQDQTESLRAALGRGLVRWVPIENMHLTLKFIGDISSANVDMLAQMLTAEAQACPSFSMEVNGLGSFPSPRRARVVWIGIHAPAALTSLQRGIESAASRLGYEEETRPFSPHLTIGRVRQQVSASDQQKVRAALEQTSVGALGTAEVTAVHLFKSDLKPSGAEYTCLFSAPLKNESPR
ncbi:MAG: RNA 2',3'-cyclic phosphodiesterase [Anaerolineaceae bacterium]|nr:MAG: RNA 2',3'-cyclic phosphodiesterase [Anaerolineaceae bacterium]